MDKKAGVVHIYEQMLEAEQGGIGQGEGSAVRSDRKGCHWKSFIQQTHQQPKRSYRGVAVVRKRSSVERGGQISWGQS